MPHISGASSSLLCLIDPPWVLDCTVRLVQSSSRCFRVPQLCHGCPSGLLGKHVILRVLDSLYFFLILFWGCTELGAWGSFLVMLGRQCRAGCSLHSASILMWSSHQDGIESGEHVADEFHVRPVPKEFWVSPEYGGTSESWPQPISSSIRR